MLISIIIPAYNVEDYIEECIHSAYAQTYKPTEVICIDNNSQDNTWQKLLKLKAEYPNLILEKELSPGAPAARNKGLALSKGEWIQFLDADDLLLPEKIEHQAGLIKPHISFIAGAYTKVSINGKRTPVIANSDDHIKELFISNLGITSSTLWQKSSLTRIGGWNEELKSSQEATLMFKLLKTNHGVIYNSKRLTIIRERETGQISTKVPHQNWENYVHLRLNILDWLKEERLSYFIENKEWYNSALFEHLRVLNQFDTSKASQMFELYLGNKYVPQKSNILYKLTLIFSNFKRAEAIRNFFLKFQKC